MQNVTVTVRKAGESHVNNPTIVTVSINSTATAACKRISQNPIAQAVNIRTGAAFKFTAPLTGAAQNHTVAANGTISVRFVCFFRAQILIIVLV